MEYNPDWEGKPLMELPKEVLIEIINELEKQIRELAPKPKKPIVINH